MALEPIIRKNHRNLSILVVMRLRNTVPLAMVALFCLFTAACAEKTLPGLSNDESEQNTQQVDTSEPAVFEVQLKLRDSDRILAGVNVDVQWDDAGNPSKTNTHSNVDGLVRLEFDHGAQLLGVIANPSAHSAPGSMETSTVLLGGQTHRIELVLPPAAGLMGTVYDVEGLPVEGAKVVCYFHSPEFVDKQIDLKIDVYTTSDENGRFAVGGIPQGPFIIEAAFENQMSVWRPGGVVDEGEILRDLEVFLEPAHKVYGQVIDGNENTVSKAFVVAGKPNRRKNRKATDHPMVFSHGPRAIVVRSDDDGMFVLPAVPDSQSWNVNVRHPDFTRSISVVDAGQIDVWVEMEEAMSLVGTVTDSDGKPIGNTQLWLLTYGGDISVGTDTEGNYKFSDLKDIDDVYAIAHHPQHGTALLGPITFGGDSQSLSVVLTKGKSVSGRVVNAAGDPQANVGVQIKGALPREDFVSDRLPEVFLGIDSLLTNSNGEFRFDNLYDNKFMVSVYPTGADAVFKNGVSVGDDLQIVVGE